MNFDLKYLLRPKSIATAGVSKDTTRIGARLLKHLIYHGYHGLIFPVNPKYEEIEGIEGMKCYPNIASIPSEIDVILVAVPEQFVCSILEEGGRGRVKSAIIYSTGDINPLVVYGKNGGVNL